jgi:hypothetical protein
VEELTLADAWLSRRNGNDNTTENKKIDAYL